MNLTEQIAKHFRDVHFGGNWTTSNLKDNLADVNWKQATTQVYNLNTIATLTYYTSYYVDALSRVLNNEPLNAKDELSFNHPPIESEEDWQHFLEKIWLNAENAAQLIEQLPQEKLGEDFTDEKYGNYHRNIHGIIEQMHYHLGQIVLIKKILLHKDN